MPKPTLAHSLMLAVLVALATAFALVPARAEQVHRYGFGGKNTVLVRGDANVKVEEKEHDISTQSFKSQPTSEHLKLTADAATGDSAFIYYHYDTPPAPVTAAFSAGVWVKATKPGVQLRARVVFPKEPDPARPETPLTALIVGDTYKARNWEKLTLNDAPALVGKLLPVLQTKIGRAVNSSGAYVDQLVLNLYTGPGTADVWIDDLDVGPVKPPEEGKPGAPGVPVGARPAGEVGAAPRGRLSTQRGGQLIVEGKDGLKDGRERGFFFRAVRHTGTPLYVLRQAGFDALWVPSDVPQNVLDEANREGWLIVPAAPLAPPPSVTDVTAVRAARDALGAYHRKFSGTDVLFWDLGGGRTADQEGAVERTKNLIREFDPQRPTGADVWDGFQGYSAFLDVVGAHRWPLFTSLELVRYRDWLSQRNALVSNRAVFWTWVQNHLPAWYLTTVLGQKEGDAFADPIGPHPEQVRLLAYIGVACGCRGLGFWSDRSLADSHHGRDRLQGMAILNAELEMLGPVMMAAGRQRTQWLDTSDPNVKAALIRTGLGTVLLPIWLGKGSQYVPDQGAIGSLKITVPLIEDGADPWRVTPAGVECLRNSAIKKAGGTELTIPEFDLVTPIVFTNDQTQNGLVVWWQDYARKYGRVAARWAMDLAAEEYDKTYAVHAKLAAMGVTVRGSESLFQQAVKSHESARQNFAAELYDKAFADALRALRPLRVVMRDHFNMATATLDVPSASPYAVSYFSLPKHWELFREIQACRPGANALPNGAFEPDAGVVIPKEGFPIDAVPGWGARYGTIDRVKVAAGVVSSEFLADVPVQKQKPKDPKLFAPSRPIPLPSDGYVPPAPELGRGVLKLEVKQSGEVGRDGKPIEKSTHPLERTFLAVESAPVRLPPGTLVCVSGWMKIAGEVRLTADGVLFYDDIGGEQLGARQMQTDNKWKQFHLYRRVPATGQVSLTVALTGVGIAYFDDLRIEPLQPAAGKDAAGYGPPAPRGAPAAPRVPAPIVQPAGGVRP
ncbi:hypothetical protein [Frigoriglobus tundricola]|uniref:Uncharacterized protein n=1 Tax=Frigoriglobus tundricola TaxID=2774151 RepID=A0A6M5YSH3_9BACT|nr:hypothetical protein [Frigoriglobus tundricola]QJW97005.1 hypothetical protein FTUN_4565 [Frigoriglobus tundricola]